MLLVVVELDISASDLLHSPLNSVIKRFGPTKEHTNILDIVIDSIGLNKTITLADKFTNSLKDHWKVGSAITGLFFQKSDWIHSLTMIYHHKLQIFNRQVSCKINLDLKKSWRTLLLQCFQHILKPFKSL